MSICNPSCNFGCNFVGHNSVTSVVTLSVTTFVLLEKQGKREEILKRFPGKVRGKL